MKRSCSLLTVLCLAMTLIFTAAAAERPNILLIMSDDMGFSDIGCYGSEIHTPTLDSLAANGVRMTQFYNNARCCPTRASLLTGLYPHQAGIGHMMEDRGIEGYKGNLNNRSVTIAEVMRAAGYGTYMCGKWHVTRFGRLNANKATWPVQRGFDRFYGTISGAGSFYDPTTLCRQNTYITPENDPEYKPERFYYTDALSDNAVKFLKDHSSNTPEKPFFMYLAYTAAHWPMHALPEDIERYKGNYSQGYDAARKQRIERLKALGFIDPAWTPAPTVGDWSSVENKPWEERCMEVYAAMIDRMDQGIGRIVAQLKTSGQLDNTVILFLQDNGGCAEPMGRAVPNDQPTGSPKPFGPDDLQPKVWPPMQTRDGRWMRRGPGVMPGPADTYVAYGEDWANVSNTPFREYKHWVHEGGISTPLIVHWPAGIPASRRGALEAQPAHIIDIMATCVDLGRAQYPREFNGNDIKSLQGVSLAPAFQGKEIQRKEPIFWEHESNRAVRQGKWKLVAKADKRWELYDMEKDRTEMNDLAAENPGMVRKLSAAWDAWAARSDVLPLGAWRAPAISTPTGKKKKERQSASR